MQSKDGHGRLPTHSQTIPTAHAPRLRSLCAVFWFRVSPENAVSRAGRLLEASKARTPKGTQNSPEDPCRAMLRFIRPLLLLLPAIATSASSIKTVSITVLDPQFAIHLLRIRRTLWTSFFFSVSARKLTQSSHPAPTDRFLSLERMDTLPRTSASRCGCGL